MNFLMSINGAQNQGSVSVSVVVIMFCEAVNIAMFTKRIGAAMEENDWKNWLLK